MSTKNVHHRPSSSSMITKILSVDNDELEDQGRYKVKQKLLQDAQYLLEKKKKDEDKKEKVKIMQKNYVERMQRKRKAITDKETKSQQCRQRYRQQQDKKYKFKSTCYQKVVDKIQTNHKKYIRSALKLQKYFYDRLNSISPKASRSNLMSSRKSQPLRQQQLMFSIDQKMARIVDKTNKAQKLHEYLNNIMIQKFKNRARIVQQTQQRYYNRSMIEQSQKYRNMYQKNDELQKYNQRSRQEMEKKNIQKAKSMKLKLDKYMENLRQLSAIEKQRNRKLDIKYNKKSKPKTWKDQRNQRYQEKFIINSQKIGQQKQLKAQQILHKHQQISLENKIYKEQKDKLIQAVKFSI